MQITTDLTRRIPTPAVLTIGTFDGVHLGHQSLIANAVNSAHSRGLPAAAMTFDPAPREVLRPASASGYPPLAYLTTLPTRLQLLAGTGLDEVVVVRFTKEMSLMSAREFVSWVRQYLPFVELWEGRGFALGHQRTGNLEVLAQLGVEMGFSVHVTPTVEVDGLPVSSTRIRQAVMAGDVETAARLLGHYHIVPGTVVPGSKRGRELGFPTANLAVVYNLALPADGVYATWAVRPATGEVLPSVTSVGTRPTFEDDARLVEVYIMDYDASLYGETIAAHFVSFIRPQIRFESIGALVQQMAADTAQARAMLATSPPPGVNAGAQNGEDSGHAGGVKDVEQESRAVD